MYRNLVEKSDIKILWYFIYISNRINLFNSISYLIGMYFNARKGFMQKGKFSIIMTCHFLQSIWQGDKESFLFNTYIYLTILLFFPTIKTHIISLQSVINNMYTSHVDRYEGKKKRDFNVKICIVLLLWYAKENNHFSGSFHF